MPSALQYQQEEMCQLHGSKLGVSAQGSSASPHWHKNCSSPWPNDMKHVFKEVIVLEEEITHYLPVGAQGQGEKHPHACHILLFVMM